MIAAPQENAMPSPLAASIAASIAGVMN